MNKASLGQGKQILDLLSGATSEEVQMLIEHGHFLKFLLQADLSQAVTIEFLCSLNLVVCRGLWVSPDVCDVVEFTTSFIDKSGGAVHWSEFQQALIERFTFFPFEEIWQHPNGSWYNMDGLILKSEITPQYRLAWYETLDDEFWVSNF